MRAEPAVLVMLALSLVAGCYEYAPIGAAPPAPGTQLRISLSDQGTVELRPQLGPSVAQLEGRVEQSDDSSITLGVTEVVRRSGIPETWNGESVRIARTQIDDGRARRFSSARTAVVAGILVGGTVIAAVTTRGGPGTVAVPPQGPPQTGH